jgi:4-carboxymuconolactone decarboxylase
MTRVDLLDDERDLTPEQRTVADRIAESRGEVSRPFQLLLHSPALAERVAQLGHLVRTGSSLTDADRELVTLAAGRAIGCSFVWESHLRAATAAGIPSATIVALERDTAGLGERERLLVSFVNELCGTRTVSEATFVAVHRLLGVPAVVELALTVGYYTMLGSVMGACDEC